MSIDKMINAGISVHQRSGKSYMYHYLMVILMLSSAILGSTIFGEVQVLCELILFVLLIYGVLHVKFKLLDIFLLSTFFFFSLLSFFRNEFSAFALNFKIYGLCILTLIYFRKRYFYPQKLILILHVLNFLLITHQFITGHFIVQSAWFFGTYKGYANDRPVGVFLTPHASAFFIAIYIIYIINLKKKYFEGMFFLILIFMTSSLTSTLALLAQLGYGAFNFIVKKMNFFKIKIGWTVKSAFIVIPIFLLSIYAEELIDFLKAEGGYTRYYSVEIILNQLFDSRFFSDIFDFIPRNYQDFISEQERGFADFGNEIGFVKVFVEGGFLLGLITLFVLIKRLKHYAIFILVTLMHYSFIINMPFMLFLIMMFNHEIESLKISENLLKQKQQQKNDILLK